MARKVTARILIRMFDGSDPARLRGLLRARQMIRRDTNGAIVVEQILESTREKKNGGAS